MKKNGCLFLAVYLEVFKALTLCEGNVTAAAKALGISRQGLNEKIAKYKKLGLEVPGR
jgi:DNA-binding protein Fis